MAATASITATNLRRTLLALAAMMLLLGLPALSAGLALSTTLDLRDRLYNGHNLSPQELDHLITSRTSAARWWHSADIADDLAMAYLARATIDGIDSDAGRKHLPTILRWQNLALARNPANSYGWARLAYARMLYNGPSALVTEALQASIETAPFEPRLMASRLALMMATERYWSPVLRERFAEQVKAIWPRQQQRMDVITAAVEGGFVPRLRTVLADDAGALAQLARGLRQLGIKPD